MVGTETGPLSEAVAGHAGDVGALAPHVTVFGGKDDITEVQFVQRFSAIAGCPGMGLIARDDV
jgi:hypothetical protein